MGSHSDEEESMTILYASTNETLDAIMAGLEPNKNDNILSILGSGDQAFAMLEYGCKVVAVERDFLQGVYAVEMKKTLEKNDFKKFLDDYYYEYGLEKKSEERNSYFLKPGRLKKIRQKLGNLEMRHGDILKLPEAGKFSKVYLSNALGYGMTIDSINKAEAFMASLAGKLKHPGIVYIAGKHQKRIVPGSLPIILNKSIRIPDDFEVDRELTEKAQAKEKAAIPWLPFVLRRKA